MLGRPIHGAGITDLDVVFRMAVGHEDIEVPIVVEVDEARNPN